MSRRQKMNEKLLFTGSVTSLLVTNTINIGVAPMDFPGGISNFIMTVVTVGVGTGLWTAQLNKIPAAGGGAVALAALASNLDMDVAMDTFDAAAVPNGTALNEGDAIQLVLTKDGGTATTAAVFGVTILAIG